ncbi:MAG: type I restriction endonuclease, partial [Candidatus Paceibacterota bacterium]
MTKAISEQALEDVMVAELVKAGYHQRQPSAYDKALCLDAGPLIDFIQATQPREWDKFAKQHGESARSAFLKRVAQAVESDGVITVLRQAVKANGCKFRLAFFQPETSRNPESEKLYQANQFSVIRQLRYSEKSDHSLDVVLFLNGLPLFTVELKNPLNGQDVRDAITQYKKTRDPREPLFLHGRCVAHFAVDPFLVYMTTQLKGKETFFLPFNIGVGEGKNKGAGNPPPKLGDGFSTSYLWKEIWTKDRILELMQYFIQDVRERDEHGKLKRSVIFPRYHQLSAVRSLVADAREKGPGENYLIQHSAGSGKSNSIGWLAHRLASLHGADDCRVFDSVIVVTDRVALDRQLSRTVSSFEQTAGLVVHVDSGRELMDGLESGKQIIITTLQKFPVVLEHVRKMEDEWRKQQNNAGGDAGDPNPTRERGADPAEMPKFYKPDGHRFALVLDEAHSSQGGEASKEMKRTLRDEDDDDTLSPAEMAAADQKTRGRLPHVSTFAFTATPKHQTLNLFGRENEAPAPGEPRYRPFDLYSMRQAIEEGFILDVLKNYVSYHTIWTLSKKIKEDPSYDPNKASKLLTRFVAEDPKTIREKVAIICEHLDSTVLDAVNGRGRAMLVTSSRQSAVTFRLEVDKYLAEQGLKWKAIVAFSGTVTDEESGKEYTETNMNGFPDAQTASKFDTEPYRLLIVANKFQTGFDQPLLHTMYVDKTLSGVAAVQTLSRLNRTMKGKDETCVVDFVSGNPDRVKEAFSRYYGETSLKEGTDPNDLYKIEGKLKRHGFFFPDDVEAFNRAFYVSRPSQDKIYAVLKPIVERVESATEAEQKQFRSNLSRFVDLYAFLGQIISFSDVELEQLFQFCRYLLRIVPVPKEDQPRELKRYVEVDTIKLRKQRVDLLPETDKGTLEVHEPGSDGEPPQPPQPEPLSEILKRLNERFGTDITGPAAEEFLESLETKLDDDRGLAASFAVNTAENARLTFDNKVRDHVQDMIDTNFK